jgi:fumarate reductase subunit D
MTPARKKLLVVLGYAVTLLLCYGLLSVPNLTWSVLICYGSEVGKWLFYGLLVLALLVALIRFVKWVWNWDSHHQRG